MKNRMVMKLIAVVLMFNIITMPIYSNSEKKVYAEEVLLTRNLTYCIMLLTSGIAGLGLIQQEQWNYSTEQINYIADYISNNKPDLISNINKLGDAIGKKADKAYIQALATGATVYALLDALSIFKYNGGEITAIYNSMYSNAIKYSDISNYSSQFQYFESTATSDYYYFNQYSKYFKGGYPLLHRITEFGSDTSDYYYYSISNLVMPIEYKYIQIYFPRYLKSSNVWADEINSSGKFLSNMLTISRDVYVSYWAYDYEYVVSIPRISGAMDFFVNNGLISDIDAQTQFENGITYSLSNLNNISIPTVIPDNTITDINNWDGVSNLVIGLPSDYVMPGDDLIIVDPTTIGDPDIEIPIDPPVEEENLLGTVGKILTSILPISGLLDNIDTTVEGIKSTVTTSIDSVIDGIGDISSTITTGIDSILNNITDITNTDVQNAEQLDLNPIKNIPGVLFSRFPFSIPFDFYNIIAFMGGSARAAPVFEFKVPLSSIGQADVVKTIDMEPFDQIAGYIRIAELIAFSIAVMLKTKTLIWG